MKGADYIVSHHIIWQTSAKTLEPKHVRMISITHAKDVSEYLQGRPKV